MRKTLVFYKGRAPHGHKSDWIMHEYRLDDVSAAGHPGGSGDVPYYSGASSPVCTNMVHITVLRTNIFIPPHVRSTLRLFHARRLAGRPADRDGDRQIAIVVHAIKVRMRIYLHMWQATVDDKG
jgi:hypothetical protein